MRAVTLMPPVPLPTLGENGSFGVVVTFAPIARGPVTCTIPVESNDIGLPDILPLQGLGQAPRLDTAPTLESND